MAFASLDERRAGAPAYVGIVRGGVSDEFYASGALTFAATPRVTIAGELLVRRLSDVRQFTIAEDLNPLSAGVITQRLVPGEVTVTQSSAVTGVKWNAGTRLVLTGEVLWRLGKAGLTAPFTPTIAIDYLF
jgi:anti-sigma factor RsiW